MKEHQSPQRRAWPRARVAAALALACLSMRAPVARAEQLRLECTLRTRDGYDSIGTRLQGFAYTLQLEVDTDEGLFRFEDGGTAPLERDDGLLVARSAALSWTALLRLDPKTQVIEYLVEDPPGLLREREKETGTCVPVSGEGGTGRGGSGRGEERALGFRGLWSLGE
jgi:hypothetical protein